MKSYPNNNSTVKFFRRGSFNVLSLGDVESADISARLRRDKYLSRETDVMILAHHGADNGFTNKSFLERIEPRLAICSSDFDNQHDHPRDEVRGLLYEQGIRLMTTKTGDIIVESIGDHTGPFRATNLNLLRFRLNTTSRPKRSCYCRTTLTQYDSYIRRGRLIDCSDGSSGARRPDMNEATECKIGLALSGEGARAMAFHLGCLRALKKLGLLDRVSVLSTVSGGSVIGALYAASDEPFEDFEARLRAVLSKGLMGATVRAAFFTPEGLKALLCFCTLGPINLAFVLATWLAWFVSLLLPAHLRPRWPTENCHFPFRRYASRTTIFRRAVDHELFHGKKLVDLASPRPFLIINSSELRTGSAFYFSARESGSWRLGRLAQPDISLAHAVTASAAYPLFLPALDEDLAHHAYRRRGIRQSWSRAAVARPRCIGQPECGPGRCHHLLPGRIRAAPRPAEPIHGRPAQKRVRLHPRSCTKCGNETPLRAAGERQVTRRCPSLSGAERPQA